MKHKMVLLIDDDIDDQEFFITALSSIDNTRLYGVVNNGKEAINLLTKSLSLPDVIFMDCNMPLMNGKDCLNEILQNPRTHNIPVIMLSSSIDQKELFIQLGAKNFIKKAQDIASLQTELRQAMESISVTYEKSTMRISV